MMDSCGMNGRRETPKVLSLASLQGGNKRSLQAPVSDYRLFRADRFF